MKRRLSIAAVFTACFVMLLSASLPHHHHHDGSVCLLLGDECADCGECSDIHDGHGDCRQHHDDECACTAKTTFMADETEKSACKVVLPAHGKRFHKHCYSTDCDCCTCCITTAGQPEGAEYRVCTIPDLPQTNILRCNCLRAPPCFL